MRNVGGVKTKINKNYQRNNFIIFYMLRYNNSIYSRCNNGGNMVRIITIN